MRTMGTTMTAAPAQRPGLERERKCTAALRAVLTRMSTIALNSKRSSHNNQRCERFRRGLGRLGWLPLARHVAKRMRSQGSEVLNLANTVGKLKRRSKPYPQRLVLSEQPQLHHHL